MLEPRHPKLGLQAVSSMLSVVLGTAPLVAGASSPQVPTADPAYFVERSVELGVEFTHSFFGTGEKHMTENMGAGVALLDVDDDGRLDIYPTSPQRPQFSTIVKGGRTHFVCSAAAESASSALSLKPRPRLA